MTIPRHAQANDPAMRVDQQSHTVAKATSRLTKKTRTPGTTPATVAMSRSRTAQAWGTLTRFATESGIWGYSPQPMRSSSIAKSSYHAAKPGAAVW